MATKVYELIAPCHFGLEAVLKKEILDLGYEIAQVEDGKVTFLGDAEAICRANIFLRTTERILLKVGSFKAVTFEELFQGTKALPWEEYIPQDGISISSLVICLISSRLLILSSAVCDTSFFTISEFSL